MISNEVTPSPVLPDYIRGLELAKWIAIVTMTIDHFGKIVEPSLYVETNMIGRLTYPLFAWIIGMRLATHPERSKGYLVNLLSWALVSQPVYVLVGKHWTDPNIFFTLALGVAAFRGVEMFAEGSRTTGAVLFLSCGALALLVDYGIAGVLLIPLVAELAKRNPEWGAWIVGPLGVLSNLTFLPPYVGPGALYAMLGSAAAVGCLRFRFALPRWGKQFFYGYYPGHLLVLYLVWFSLA